jgi:hypothetical protein
VALGRCKRFYLYLYTADIRIRQHIHLLSNDKGVTNAAGQEDVVGAAAEVSGAAAVGVGLEKEDPNIGEEGPDRPTKRSRTQER